jgi:pyridoxal biosynthesis lyase PdxS
MGKTMRKALQQFTQGDVVADFTDKRQNTISAKAHPRDIVIKEVRKDGKVLRLRDRDIVKLKEAIAVDMRLGQGYPEVGVAKGLLYK